MKKKHFVFNKYKKSAYTVCENATRDVSQSKPIIADK